MLVEVSAVKASHFLRAAIIQETNVTEEDTLETFETQWSDMLHLAGVVQEGGVEATPHGIIAPEAEGNV
jgi:hypothetical protein